MAASEPLRQQMKKSEEAANKIERMQTERVINIAYLQIDYFVLLWLQEYFMKNGKTIFLI